MRPQHLLLAVAIAAIWGFNFVAIKLGVNALAPFLLTALRFLLAALPAVFFVARPNVSFGWVAAFGLMLGIGQFGFLFMAMHMGLPAGLTSVIAQLQAFFTMFFAWLVLSEIPRSHQLAGAAIAFSGIAVIGYSRWSGPQAVPLVLAVIASAGWAASNIIAKMARPKDTLSFVIWSSLVVPIPMLLLSGMFEDNSQSMNVLAHPTFAVVASVLYLAFLSTLFGYGAWNFLLNHYPASTVAPFSLLVPLFGILGGAVAFGERFDAYEMTGAALIVGGLLVSNLWGRYFQMKKAEPEGSAN